MPHPLSNSMLPATGASPSRANGIGVAARSAAAGDAPPSDDSFARALEQRMGADPRAPQRRERETSPERTAQRPADTAHASGTGAAARPTRTRRDEQAPAPDSTESADGIAEAEAEARPGAPAALPGKPVGRADVAATADAGAADAADAAVPVAVADPATPVPTAAAERDAAAEPVPAALAGMLPIVAAPHTPVAATAHDGAVLEGAEDGSGTLAGEGTGKRAAIPLEQLLRDATRPEGRGGKPTKREGAPFAATLDRTAKVDPAQPTALAGVTQPLPAAEATPLPDASAALRPGAGQAAGAAQAAPEGSALGLAASGLTTAPRAEQAQLPQMSVPTPAGQRAWAEDVGNRVMWMVGRNDAKAELVLTPPHLGKLEVSIQVTGEQTTAHFVAASSAARDALEQAMPRLREILQQAGIQLGQANVSTSGEQQAHQHGSQRPGRALRGFGAAGDAIAGAPSAGAASGWTRAGSTMVDTFA